MYFAIVAILAARGVTQFDPTRDYRIHDDGSGPYIAHWDEAKLGPRPTQEELDAVDVAKIEHNAGIDRQIAAVEAMYRMTERAQREGHYGTALLADALNVIVGQIEAALRTIPGQDGLALARLPDLKQNTGMKKIKTAEDLIKPLRQQRLP